MEIAPELVEQMVALVRFMEADASERPGDYMTCSGEVEAVLLAREIAALIPKPIDPDLIEARKICHDVISVDVHPSTGAYIKGELDGSLSMRCALAAIKLGRELERSNA